MAASYRDIRTAIQTSGTSVAITLPTHSAGDLLLCLAAGYNDTDTMTLSPPGTGTWTALTDSVEIRGRGQTENIRARIWGRAATGSEPGTLSPSSNLSTYLVGALMSVQGADTTTILDATSVVGTGDTATRTNAGITTVTDGALLVMFSIGFNGTVATPPSPMSQRAAFDSVSYAYTEERPTFGPSGSRNHTQDATSSYIAALLAIKPAAGGGAASLILPRGPRLPLAILAR